MTPGQRKAVDDINAQRAKVVIDDGEVFRDSLESLADSLDAAETAVAEALSALAAVLALVPKSA